MRENDRKREGKGEDFRREMNSRTRGKIEKTIERIQEIRSSCRKITFGRSWFTRATRREREIIPMDFSTPENGSACNYIVDIKQRMFIIMPKSRSEVKSKENIWKCIFASVLREVLGFDRYVSLGTYASAKLHDSRSSRVILLKGWSLCTPGLEQHRLSSGKNPRKSFLPFPISAKRRRHFPRGTNLSLPPFPILLLTAYLFHPPPSSLHSSFHAFCSSLVNLSFAGPRLEANGKARKYRKGGLTKHLKASREKNIDKELEKRDEIESDR